MARSDGYSLFITPRELIVTLKPQGHLHEKIGEAPPLVRMRLEGAEVKAQWRGQDEMEGKVNYLLGRDPSKWRRNVPLYAKVWAENIYPSIDMVYYGKAFDGAQSQNRLEFDFVVNPGGSPRDIRLKFMGEGSRKLDGKGNLVIAAGKEKVIFRAPSAYQQVEGGPRKVESRYVFLKKGEVGFEVGNYATDRPLIIDPVLDYSTYLGGVDSDFSLGITVDTLGNAYLTGATRSTNFPATAGAYQTTPAGAFDAFVAKLNPSGTALVYATFLGGSAGDVGHGVWVDASGNAYVTGQTDSIDFPATVGAAQTLYGGGFGDAFVVKLNPAGSGIVYSTFLGGTGNESGQSLSVDGGGNAYVAGWTDSIDFPIQAGAFQSLYGGNSSDAFAAKLNPSGTTWVYSTYLGASGTDGSHSVALDGGGNAYVAGYTNSLNFPTTAGAYQMALGGGMDGFITKLNPLGAGLSYSTYLGSGASDNIFGITVDAGGSAYVVGATASINFPITAGAYQPTFGGGVNDGFVAKMNLAGTGLIYSTFLGGSGIENGFAIAIDGGGNAYVTGPTDSIDFPTTAGAVQAAKAGFQDIFIAKLDSGGTGLVYSTYLGGADVETSHGIAVDGIGDVYVGGSTESLDFPTTAGAPQTAMGGGSDDAFASKIKFFLTPTPAPILTPTPTPSCISHIWPNPFNANYAVNGTLKIDCLPSGSVVSFYTVSGELVQEIPEFGGWAQWNGRNKNGIPVSTGIYYFAVLKDGNSSGQGKFLVTH
jgi:hypothetical protein